MDLGTIAGFDWDEGNRAKCQKHGVTLDEIEALLIGPSHTGPARSGQGGEERQYAIITTAAGRSLFIVFTVRGPGDRRLIRPISARYMHGKELDRHA